MRRDIQQLITNPEDVPNVPKGVKSYLQATLSADYLDVSGHLEALKARGYSEAAIFGFIMGVQYSSKMLDEMEAMRDSFNSEG